MRISSKAALEVNKRFTLTIFNYTTTSLIPDIWYSFSKNLNVLSFREYEPQRPTCHLFCMRILERKVLLKRFSTRALKSPRATACSFSPSLVFDSEKGWHKGSPTLVFCLPFLASCVYVLGSSWTDRTWRLSVWGQDPALPALKQLVDGPWEKNAMVF